MRNILVNSMCASNPPKNYRNIVNTLCNNVNSGLTFQYKYSKMAMQINDIDLDYISILQTEYGNTSDITINYSSDASSIGTIILFIISIMIVIKSILHGEKPINIRHIILIIL